MAHLVAPGNHIADLGHTTDATVGSDPACTLGIRGDFGLAAIHFHIVRDAKTPGARIVPIDSVGTPVVVNDEHVPDDGILISSGDKILAGFIELTYEDGTDGSDSQATNGALLAYPHSQEDGASDLAHTISHLPPAAAPSAHAEMPASGAGELLQLPTRSAPPIATAASRTMEALRLSTVRWSIRAAVLVFFLAVGSSLMNARFPVVQDFWGGVAVKVKLILEPAESAPPSGAPVQFDRDA